MTNTDGDQNDAGLTERMARGETARQLREMTNRMPKSLGGWASTIGVLAAWMAVISGCGGGSSTPITEDSYCQQKAEKECQVAPKCGTVVDACVTQRKTACLAVNAMSRTAPRIFTPGNVGACINATSSVYQKANSSQATQTDIDNMNDICAYVFQGNVESGAACTVKYDCKNKNQICDTKNGTSLCSDKVQKSKGQPCGNHGEVCANDSYCAMDATSGSYMCIAKAAQSAACSATVPCVDPFRCDAASGICMPKLMSGQLCNSSADCAMAAPFCDQYLGCKCDLGLSFAAGAFACMDYGGGPNITPACGAGGSMPDAGTNIDAGTSNDAATGG